MRQIFNILIILLVVLLAYMLYSSIKEPIQFEAAKSKRQLAVTDKLEDIRRVQEIYRNITGKFANSFDSLSIVMKNDSIPFVMLTEDPEDPTNADKFQRVVTYSPAIDSIRSLDINLDSLRYVPYSDGSKFDIDADTITYQSTLVNVVEVGTTYKEFMGKYATKKYSKYDQSYDPNKRIKFGDMSKPNLSGSWDR